MQTSLSFSLTGFGKINRPKGPGPLGLLCIWRTGWFVGHAGASPAPALSHAFFTWITSDGEGHTSKCWSWRRRLWFWPGFEELKLFVHTSGMLHSSVKDQCGSVGLCLPLLGTPKANPSSAKPLWRGSCCCLWLLSCGMRITQRAFTGVPAHSVLPSWTCQSL